MADTLFKTYEGIGNREDLTDIISNISPTETPFLSRFGRTAATAVTHEWQTDALASADGAGAVEGSDIETSSLTATTRLKNYTQIMRRSYRVSKTQEAVRHAGRASEFGYQAEKALKELARNMEKALHDNTGNTGNATGARALIGVRSWITTNISTGTGTGLSTMTSSDLNSNLQKAWEQGGMPESVYVNGTLKKRISSFTTPNTRYMDSNSKTFNVAVNVYDSDFGKVEIVPDRYATVSEVLCLQNSLWKVAFLRPIERIALPDNGGGPKGAFECEFTLEALNQAGSSKMTDWV